MRVSEKKKKAAYSAISDTIMDFRISAEMNGEPIHPLELDSELFKLEIKIWKRLKVALNIEGL